MNSKQYKKPSTLQKTRKQMNNDTNHPGFNEQKIKWWDWQYHDIPTLLFVGH